MENFYQGVMISPCTQVESLLMVRFFSMDDSHVWSPYGKCVVLRKTYCQYLVRMPWRILNGDVRAIFQRQTLCSPRRFNGATAPFHSLYGAAALLYLPESMDLCVVNGQVVGAVRGGHVAVGCSLELMLPKAFLWCDPTLSSLPIDLTHSPNRAWLIFFPFVAANFFFSFSDACFLQACSPVQLPIFFLDACFLQASSPVLEIFFQWCDCTFSSLSMVLLHLFHPSNLAISCQE